MKRILVGVLALCLIASPIYGIGYDTSVKLLAHFNGATEDKPTPATTGQVITYVGTAWVSTATTEPLANPPDTAALLLDGDSDYVTVPDSADWTFGDAAWTVDCWANPTAYGAGTNTSIIFGQFVDVNNHWYVGFFGAGGSLELEQVIGGARTNTTTASGVSLGSWAHFAAVSTGGTTVKVYVNGTLLLSSATFTTFSDLASVFYMGHGNGCATNNGVATYFNGYIDEPRVSKGVARWTADFTPPIREYKRYIQGISST